MTLRLAMMTLLSVALLATTGVGQKPQLQQQPARVAQLPPKGVLPVDADGKPLNLDFETGDLRDWKAEGEAFVGQPIKGDTVVQRRADMKSEHQGQFWIGGFEKKQDPPLGTLTSVSFKVTHPWASFLVGGGPHETTCVELVRKETGKVFFRTSGAEVENLARVVIDLEPVRGQEMFIRLVDHHPGHWGHLNFDDFRFHDAKPSFPNERRTVAGLFQYAGLTPRKAAEVMTVPEGFSVIPFAGEPDVRQPIAMTIDARGRLWVAECFAYPRKQPKGQAKDRILIFEDTNGDGKHDRRTVFYEGLNLVSGIEVGFGGVFVGQAPELLFIPDRDGDDKPDSAPEVLLDGWGLEDTHETLNSFIWGPDGWLYGCHGVFTHSRVGKPGTPDRLRQPLNAGIWRYHPVKREFEVFAHGTSNPWGVDFNDHGDSFLTCCVIPHLFHIIQGARYTRQGGVHFNPNTFDDIKTIANHRHWVGNQWNDADRAKSDGNGGGHAHAGAMIYLGGAWPEQYRGQLFMNNIHGARLNIDRLTPKGSGYVGDGEPDFLKANDLWSQILYLRSGPDGNVYMIDWYDRNQCHHGNDAGHDRSNGRIFKICYQGTKSVAVDLSKKSDLELVELLSDNNDWYVRTARRLLHERSVTSKLAPKTRELLAERAFGAEKAGTRLRHLWALHVTGGLNEEQQLRGLSHDCSHVRRWSVQLSCENGKPSEAIRKALAAMAQSGGPTERLAVASALQRWPGEQRWEAATALVSHAEDASDHNLPLMYWYAIEPLAEVDRTRALELAAGGKIPQLLPFMIRRVGSGSGDVLTMLVGELGKAKAASTQLAFLRGLEQSLVGRRQVAMPANWPVVSKQLWDSSNREVSLRAKKLAVTFGDADALELFRRVASNTRLSTADRREAVAVLLNAGDRNLAPVLQEMLSEPSLREEALRGLASYDHPDTPKAILAIYAQLTGSQKQAALATLSSRVPYASTLLAAVGTKSIPSTDLTADIIRQMRNLKNAAIDEKIRTVWGSVRESTGDRAKLIATYKTALEKQRARPEDLPLGRAVFVRICQQCHTLFDVGGKVGPELTGSNRADLDYLLSNILDPSAVMAKEYNASVITTSKGRVITGIVKEQTKNAVTVVTATETVVVPRSEIDELALSEQSMMPDDLLKPLDQREVRALVAYLASPRQTALQATSENATLLFNGKDLTGWQGNAKLWKVDKGEIVGTSPGIQKNEFLVSQMEVRDFRFICQVKLTPNKENSGIQFRSRVLPGGDVKGYQADIGAGWWGKLYEEHGRGLLWDKSGEKHVKEGDWNRYEIEAIGSRVRTYLNGKLCVDLDDPSGVRVGILALQIHSGGAMEIRFKDLKLEVIEKKK